MHGLLPASAGVPDHPTPRSESPNATIRTPATRSSQRRWLPSSDPTYDADAPSATNMSRKPLRKIALERITRRGSAPAPPVMTET